MSEHEIDLDFLRNCLQAAGQMALEQRGHVTATIKADHTPVTIVDHQVEDYLIERIASRYPGDRVLSEESGLHPGSEETTWVIDPIDGTRSFASGLSIWGVSIGILQAGVPTAGGLCLPVTGDMFWGTYKQAFHNDQPLPLLSPPDLEDVLHFLAVPSNFHLYFESTFPRARSLGSTAAHLAYVATGAAAGALLRGINLWDMAGVLPLLAAVGAVVVPLAGESFQPEALLSGQRIRAPLLAAHPSALDALRATIHLRARAQE